MRVAIWLLLVQASLGAFDTLYYHEYRLKLAHGLHTRIELRLHAARDFAYAVIIGSLGFVTWHGVFAWILLVLLLVEICITLWDFIEEDKIRRLPPGERAMHATMGIVYGAFLAFLLPEMIGWSALPTGFGSSYHGFPAWLLLTLATGVFISGIRDLIASARPWVA
jgi:phosphatidylglycerophosphate synthase